MTPAFKIPERLVLFKKNVEKPNSNKSEFSLYQKVEMKDARTPETPGVPQTGDDQWKSILLFVLLGVSAAGLMVTIIYKKKHGKTEKADEAKKEE